MRITRRISFWFLLLVFLALVATWTLWIPYDPSSLYGAIPANAMLVSSHDHLAERMESLSTNILLQSFLKGITAGMEKQFDRTDSSISKTWLNRLGSRKTVFAYVPCFGKGNQPAWIITCWIGNFSHYFRWSQYWTRIPEISRLGSQGCIPIWGLNQPLTESGMKLSFAVSQGLFLGCVSRDPQSIRHVLMTYEGQSPSVFNVKLPYVCHGSSALDKGWVAWQRKNSSDRIFTSFQIPRIAPDGISADINLYSDIKTSAPLAQTIDFTFPGQLLGNIPAAMSILPMDMVDKLLSIHPIQSWAVIAKNLLKSDVLENNANSLILSVLTGDYSGGYGKAPLRIKVPAILAMVKIRQSNTVRQLILRTLDSINAQYHLGLIVDPTPFRVGDLRVFTIEPTLDNQLFLLSAEDRPAYTIFNDWLIFSSSAGSLMSLLKRVQNLEQPYPDGEWQRQLKISNACAFQWMDLDSGGKALRFAISLYSLKLRFDEAADRTAVLYALKRARSWLKDISHLKDVVIWLEPESVHPVIHINIGNH